MLETRLVELRESQPARGKAKLVVLLKAAGFKESESTVGRLLGRLLRAGRIREPQNYLRRKKRPCRKRPYALRIPRNLQAQVPGDLVEIDTQPLSFPEGRTLHRFTSCDSISRHSVTQTFSRATAKCGSLYLDELIRRTPFKIRALSIDGGSEFKGDFELACRLKGITLYVLPPRSPKG